MRLIFIFLAISSIFLLSSFQAKDAKNISTYRKVESYCVSHFYTPSCEKALVQDLLDDCADDDVNESDKKRHFSEKTLPYGAAATSENSCTCSVNKSLSSQYLFPARASLSVLISVFRI
jgi:hypothetical protein